VVDEDREAYLNQADYVFRSGEPRVTQYRCQTKAGDRIWVESHIVPIYDESGKTVGLRGVTMDITTRKKAQEALVLKENQLTEAQRLAQVGSWEWDSETDTVFWSDEIYRIYGMSPDQPPASYSEHFRLYTPDSWKVLGTAVTNALSNGTPYDLELELVRSDGKHAWGRARGEILRKDKNVKLRGTLQDITERKKADEAIRESEARFRTMADTAPVLIWIADTEMQCTYFNKKALEFTGRSMPDLCGEGWLDLVHPDDRETCFENYSSSYDKYESFSIEYRAKGG
jgi:PAS domain S-box-containing protein